MFQEQWERARETAQLQRGGDGIGTLREKLLHSAIKYTIEPNPTYHEVKVGSFVTDVVTEHGLMEIQTRNFRGLRKKLACFLETAPVTVIHPIAEKKRIFWVDEDSGEVSKGALSPKKGQPLDVFYELYWIKDFLQQPNLSLQIWLLEVEEYRRLNGWSRDKKRGATRYEQIPLKLLQVVKVENYRQLADLLPPLPKQFTKKELLKAAKRTAAWADRTLKTLEAVGLIFRVGKRGNAILYEFAPENGDKMVKQAENHA